MENYRNTLIILFLCYLFLISKCAAYKVIAMKNVKHMQKGTTNSQSKFGAAMNICGHGYLTYELDMHKCNMNLSRYF